MGAGAAVYAVAYLQSAEVGSPPGDTIFSLTQFQFGTVNDYDCHVVRGAGFVTAKAAASVRVRSSEISNDGITELQLVIRRDLRLWDDIP